MRLPVLLLIVSAALAWLATQVRQSALVEPPVIEAARRAERAPTAASAAQSPLSQEAAAAALPAAQPLFRPAQPPPSEPEGPVPGERFVLVGLAGSDEARIALLRDEADGRMHSARVGQPVGPWTLESIDASCVTLRRDRREQSSCL